MRSASIPQTGDTPPLTDPPRPRAAAYHSVESNTRAFIKNADI